MSRKNKRIDLTLHVRGNVKRDYRNVHDPDVRSPVYLRSEPAFLRQIEKVA